MYFINLSMKWKIFGWTCFLSTRFFCFQYIKMKKANYELCYSQSRKQPAEVFYEKGVLKNFFKFRFKIAKFTGKTFVEVSFSIKLQTSGLPLISRSIDKDIDRESKRIALGPTLFRDFKITLFRVKSPGFSVKRIHRTL